MTYMQCFVSFSSIKAYPAVRGCFKQKIVQATDGLNDFLSSGLSKTCSVNCYLFMPFFNELIMLLLFIPINNNEF